MEQNQVLREFSNLPPEAQRQVIDFIAFLQSRYPPATPRRAKPKKRLAEEAFIGMWRNRKDMADSSAWVRQVRETEWGEPK